MPNDLGDRHLELGIERGLIDSLAGISVDQFFRDGVGTLQPPYVGGQNRIDAPFHLVFLQRGAIRSGRKVMIGGNSAMTTSPSTMIHTKGQEALKISVVGTSGAALFIANRT